MSNFRNEPHETGRSNAGDKTHQNLIEMHEGTTNVYADLGYVDADSMRVKAQLVTAIASAIKRRAMTQTQASKLFGMPQPKVSAMLNGQFRGISEDKMMRCLVALGQTVQIVVKPARRGEAGSLSVPA